MLLYAEEPEGRGRVEQLGLTVSGLNRVVSTCWAGWSMATGFHASSAAGTYMYHEGTAALRSTFVPGGEWLWDERDGQPRIYNPVTQIAVIVQTGDERTGQPGPDPSSRRPKGRATFRKVLMNGQLEMFSEAEAGRLPITASTRTWILLVAAYDGAVHAELSMPQHMGSDDRPCVWYDRILLEQFGFDDDGTGFFGHAPVSAPDHDVDVTWQQ